MTAFDTGEIGAAGERVAARFLKKKGYKTIRRNCRSSVGEIDLVMRDGDEVVFVEVKTRASRQWGDPEEAVSRAKRRRISRQAMRFATRHNLRDRPLRFDVVAVVAAEGAAPVITHYPDAFPLSL